MNDLISKMPTSYDVVQSKKQENRLKENKRPEEKIERWSS